LYKRQALEGVASEIAASHGAIATVALLDLGDPREVAQWIERNRATLSGIDLLINNAAWADASPFLEAREGAERLAIETNALAPMALARAVLPGMLARGHGHVINVVTSGARNALPLFSSYAASKAALWAWSEALSREVEGTGVSVLSFVPPHMDSATRRQLGRRAVGFYVTGGARVSARGLDPPLRAAEEALAAAAAGRSVATPARVRWETAMNAALPERVRARVLRSWKGIRRGDR
jgi:short-subunit dehydrogenase